MESSEKLLARLAEFEPAGFPFISLYLNAQADDRGRDNYDIFVRDELRERSRSFEPGSAEKESFDRDVERILKYLEQEVKPSSNGIAIFACAGADDFFEAVQLNAPIERHSLFIYDQPHLYPLARLVDQYPRYAVLVADTNAARIFVFGRGKTIDAEEIQNVKTNRSQVGGWSQMRYQRHVENYHLHHAKEVIETLERVVREDKIEHVILAGDGTTIIPLLREQMSKQLEEKIVDVVKLDINTPEHEILESTMKTMRVHDAVTDAERIKQLLDEYRADGLAVVGVEKTLAALNNGQVDTLFLTASMKEIQYDKKKIEKVMAAYAPGGDGAETDTSEPRVVADELVTKAQQSAASVTFIEDAALLAEFGGVGARLRYKI